ncbi:MAG: hypothetical protein PHW63_02585 [Alphaproteobacteria bacterium]|nr:hypothetical protein [Alphaproteobacteria bacterium]
MTVPALYVVIDLQTKFLNQLPYGSGHLRRSFDYYAHDDMAYTTSEVFSDRRSPLCSGTRMLADKFSCFNIPTLWVATDQTVEKGLHAPHSFKSEKARQKFIHRLGLNQCGLRSNDLIWVKHYPSIFQESSADVYRPLDMNRSTFAQFLNQHETRVLFKSGQFTSLCVSRSIQLGKDKFLCIGLTDKMADNLECPDTLSSADALEPFFTRWKDLQRIHTTIEKGGYFDCDSLTARTDFGNPFWHKQRLLEFGPELMEGVILTQSRKVLNLLEKNKGQPLTPDLFLQQARREGNLIQSSVSASTCTPT